MSFSQGDTSTRQQGFEIIVFPFLGELPSAIEPHLPICQLQCWHLGPTKWHSPTNKSLDLFIVIALLVGFPIKRLGSATGGFTCNCLVPGAWTTEVSGLHICVKCI